MITDKKFIEGQLNTSRIKNNILPLLLGVTPLFSIIFDEKWVPYFIGAIVIAYFLEPN